MVVYIIVLMLHGHTNVKFVFSIYYRGSVTCLSVNSHSSFRVLSLDFVFLRFFIMIVSGFPNFIVGFLVLLSLLLTFEVDLPNRHHSSTPKFLSTVHSG